MKFIQVIIFCLLFMFSGFSYGAPAHVNNLSDDLYAEGTLRKVLQSVCDTPGDDTVSFYDLPIRIQLNDPLVIPPDCQGKVAIGGPPNSEIILELSDSGGGGQTPGDSCILNIYSDGHSIHKITFLGNSFGAGICIFGKKNLIKENHFKNSRYGVVVSNIFMSQYPEMDGSENEITGNKIEGATEDGIVLEGNDIVVNRNEITGSGGSGILIQGGSQNILIGGASFSEDGNIITQNNQGVTVLGDQETHNITVTHNSIYQNGSSGSELDLLGDGITLNDSRDQDSGPNSLLNYIDHLQVFPLVPKADGTPQFWTWGIGKSGNRVEIYTVDEESTAEKHGGGAQWIGDVSIQGSTFSLPFDLSSSEAENWVTILSFDDDGNTSEFSTNIAFGPDKDLDGIIDLFETLSSPESTDSDGDGLPDSVEDSNRNGKWEPELGETSPILADSDEDGLGDWAETHGDGHFDPGMDTNPFAADSDGDGLTDGQEDKNGNGIWEVYVMETSPNSLDTDGDGVSDDRDNCSSIFNPSQEDWFCKI